VNNRPIITVREARRLLGKDSEQLNDVEVMEVVNNLREVAKLYIKSKGVKKSDNRLGSDNGLPETQPK
jgi:hypothetical protein